MNDVERKLRQLGDPSGRQDSAFWDDWFNVVCRQQAHRPFEWYCSAEEVCRVVAHHLPVPPLPPVLRRQRVDAVDDDDDAETKLSYVMMHPGSGTSLVPVLLRTTYPSSRQIAVDISRVALDEMQEFHDQHTTTTTSPIQPIEYIQADLLLQTTDDVVRSGAAVHGIANDTCDVWIDKGFVDAVFSSDNESENRHQSAVVFQTASHLLVPQTGVAIIVSLAEDHSVQLIVENWRDDQKWQPTLHIWELEPISGDLPPLAFVLTKRSTTDATVTTGSNGGSRPDDVPPCVVWHGPQNETLQHHELSSPYELLLDEIQNLILAARRTPTSPSLQGGGDAADDDDKARKVLARIEVKPYDTEEDLVSLSERLCDAVWTVPGSCNDEINSAARVLQPQWRPFPNTAEWYRIVPIGFGISKVQLQCIIPSDDIDDLIELMQTWDEDVIQSVDVDWSNTVPLGKVFDAMPKERI